MKTEPWMRENFADLHPVIAGVLHSLQHAREDLHTWTDAVPDELLWQRLGDLGSIGFHIRHLAGSVDRLTTYATGNQLSETQLGELHQEGMSELTRGELWQYVEQCFASASTILRAIEPFALSDTREIGRKRIPVPLGTLLVHIAEHTQRHVGAAIVTAKLASSHFVLPPDVL